MKRNHKARVLGEQSRQKPDPVKAVEELRRRLQAFRALKKARKNKK